MTDREAPTFGGALFGILLLLFVFTAMEIFRPESRGKTIAQFVGICILLAGFLAWWGVTGFMQVAIGLPAAYLIHSFTFGLLMLREISPPYQGPL